MLRLGAREKRGASSGEDDGDGDGGGGDGSDGDANGDGGSGGGVAVNLGAHIESHLARSHWRAKDAVHTELTPCPIVWQPSAKARCDLSHTKHCRYTYTLTLLSSSKSRAAMRDLHHFITYHRQTSTIYALNYDVI